MKRLAIGAGIGLVFGLMLSWSGMSDPNVIREALLFENSYLYFFMFSAVATATIGIRLFAHSAPSVRERPERRHVTGALMFGIGWGVADACPGPVLTQVGQGIGWAAFTLVGVVTGVWLYRRQTSYESEPAAVTPSAAPSRESMSFSP